MWVTRSLRHVKGVVRFEKKISGNSAGQSTMNGLESPVTFSDAD